VECQGLGDTCNDVGCVEPGGTCGFVPKAFGTPCSDGDYCTTADRCVNGVCTGIVPPVDADCDAYADPIEEVVLCDLNDFYEVPTLPIYFSGSRRLNTAAETMVTWYSPRQKVVYVETDPACDEAGLCGAHGFCERGGIGDPCTVNEDCSLPSNTCRLVLNFGNIPDMTYRIVKLRGDFVHDLFPIRPGCALKVDLELPEWGKRKRVPFRMVVLGTVDGRLRRDRDVIVFKRE
jgi:hypothetical protein